MQYTVNVSAVTMEWLRCTALSAWVMSKNGYRNRGTESMRSPEMLLASSPSARPTAADSSCRQYAASDVWALGCLLYELAVGSVLFPNELDWPKFFITVTDPTQVPCCLNSLSQLDWFQQPSRPLLMWSFHALLMSSECTLSFGL